MSLTRKFLSAMGIEPDKIDEIITAHSETVDALKDQISQYKKDAEELPKVKAEYDKLMKASEGKDGKNPFEEKYNKLKEEYDSYKTDVKTKETTQKKKTAYLELLKQAGVSEKRRDSVLKVSDVDSLKLDKDGKVEGADDIIKNIKSEWSDFIVTDSTNGVKTATPPANNGGKLTRNDIMNIKDTSERQKAIADNHELFGF